MSNAALYFHPDGFDTSGAQILGRHSAGESFLRGLLRYADVDRFHLWNVRHRPLGELETLVARIHPPRQPINWIPAHGRARLREAGVLHIPGPDIAMEAWARQHYGTHAYAISGITHTTATANVMRVFADLALAPVTDHDALICTSTAVRDSVETQIAGIRDYVREQFGPRKRPEPMRATIPLGVNTGDFQTTPELRKHWRETLDIPAEAVVALYVGRFNAREKMNPALMAMALERAAKATQQPIYWVNSGWAETDAVAEQLHRDTAALCPNVHYKVVDGRPPHVRFSIWSVADFFISFSDNIQETFGLTPIEAMAAGLPCVVTDWNGYKDTVRNGVDGFRIPTLTPPAGDGIDIAYGFATAEIAYRPYVSATAQYTAMDLAEATAAISVLVSNADYRRKLGAQAQKRAREIFDWAAIIPQYQALWAEQNARRLRAPAAAPVMNNPFRPDPFALFAGYPTAQVTHDWRITMAPGMSWEAAGPVLQNPLAVVDGYHRASLGDLEAAVNLLQPGETYEIRTLLGHFPAGQRPPIGRSLLWLARFGVVSLSPPA